MLKFHEPTEIHGTESVSGITIKNLASDKQIVIAAGAGANAALGAFEYLITRV